MRTTLEIDDDLLALYRERARRTKSSIGALISKTLRESVNGNIRRKDNDEGSPFVYKNGIPMLRSRGEVITFEHVQRLLEEEDY